MADSQTFLYFAYGSNLLKERLCINNPSANFVDIACLKDHKLSFSERESETWRGGVATVTPCDGGRCVWGAVWRLDTADRHRLDVQEGCGKPGGYTAITVIIDTASGSTVTCLSYKLETSAADGLRGFPSPFYKAVIVSGAIECGLPGHYIDGCLRTIQHNGCDYVDATMRDLYERIRKWL